MKWFPIVRPRPMTGRTPAQLTFLGMAGFLLVVITARTAVAQQPPRRFFVLTMNDVNAQKAFNAMDSLAVIERDGTSWTPFPQEIRRGGRLSPDTMKYAWVEGGSEAKPKATLQIATDARFEVYDLKGNLIRSVSASGLPDASTRMITYLIDCR